MVEVSRRIKQRIDPAKPWKEPKGSYMGPSCGPLPPLKRVLKYGVVGCIRHVGVNKGGPLVRAHIKGPCNYRKKPYSYAGIAGQRINPKTRPLNATPRNPKSLKTLKLSQPV